MWVAHLGCFDVCALIVVGDAIRTLAVWHLGPIAFGDTSENDATTRIPYSAAYNVLGNTIVS